jgi:hypothetical protein
MLTLIAIGTLVLAASGVPTTPVACTSDNALPLPTVIHWEPSGSAVADFELFGPVEGRVTRMTSHDSGFKANLVFDAPTGDPNERLELVVFTAGESADHVFGAIFEHQQGAYHLSSDFGNASYSCTDNSLAIGAAVPNQSFKRTPLRGAA